MAQSFSLMNNENQDNSVEEHADDTIPPKYMASDAKQQPRGPLHAIDNPKGLSPSQQNESNILERLEPQMTNQNGHIVVEVEKVYKDIYVLYQSLRASKFFRVCINSQNDEMPETLMDVTQQMLENSRQQDIVKNYRDLLNYIFKLFVKLNNGVEQLQKQNELYRLKLLNQDLKEQNYQLKQEVEAHFTQEKVNNILNFITNDHMLMNMLSEESLSILSKVQDLSPALEKLLEHQQTLLDLFTVNETYVVNKNCAEINQNCQQFLQIHGVEILDFGIPATDVQAQPGHHMNIVDDMHLNQLGELQNSFDNTHAQYEDPNDFIDQENLTQNFLSSVAGEKFQHHNQTNFSQDQAVDLLTKVLQKLTNQQPLQANVHQVLNNTQDQIPQRAINVDNKLGVYASQQYSANFHDRKNSTISGILNIQDEHQPMNQTHQSVTSANENCIKQAESLLHLFKQSNNMQATATTNMSLPDRSGRVSKSFNNMPLQRDRSQSWTRNKAPINQAVYSSSLQAQSSSNVQNTPQNRAHLSNSQNVKSMDNMSNISASVFSAQNNQKHQANQSMFARTTSQKFSGGPPVPPL